MFQVISYPSNKTLGLPKSSLSEVLFNKLIKKFNKLLGLRYGIVSVEVASRIQITLIFLCSCELRTPSKDKTNLEQISFKNRVEVYTG